MNEKNPINAVLVVIIVALLGVIGYTAFVKKPAPVAPQTPETPALSVPTVSPAAETKLPDSEVPIPTPTTPAPAQVTPSIGSIFSSSYFTLSFQLPRGFEVIEEKNYLRIAQSPFRTRDMGDDNAFFTIERFTKNNNRVEKIALYRKLLKNLKESTTVVDGSSFLTFTGDDWGRFEGDSAGKVIVVFFEASYLEIIERPLNTNQNFDPIAIGKQILSTFRFSKA